MSAATPRFCPECPYSAWTKDYYCPDCGSPFFPNAKKGSRLRPTENTENRTEEGR